MIEELKIIQEMLVQHNRRKTLNIECICACIVRSLLIIGICAVLVSL